MRIPPSRCLPLLLASVLLAAAIGAGAESAGAAPDWASVSEVGNVEVITADEDGDVRETTVWLVVVDGEAYIRTRGTRWGANLERDPRLDLRVEGQEWPLRTSVVEDAALHERVTAAFREKYGFTDALIGLFRGSNPTIMRLLPR